MVDQEGSLGGRDDGGDPTSGITTKTKEGKITHWYGLREVKEATEDHERFVFLGALQPRWFYPRRDGGFGGWVYNGEVITPAEAEALLTDEPFAHCARCGGEQFAVITTIPAVIGYNQPASLEVLCERCYHARTA